MFEVRSPSILHPLCSSPTPLPRHLPFPLRIAILRPAVKSLFKEFFQLCWQEKKWWLVPLVVLLLLGLAALFILASNSGISWALYPSK